MSRGLLAAVTAACVAFASCALVPESAQAEPVTVKSSKSNTSDRMGGGGGHGNAAKVKGTKSNTSDRTGGAGGVPGGGALDKSLNLNSSRSNSNY